jgi:GMP synthase-like glutamine amidotransferase
MRIGILETGKVGPELAERHGDYPAMFERRLGAVAPDLDFFTVAVVAGEMPDAPGDAEGWIVTGSRHGVYDGLPWIEPLEDFLRACLAQGVPAVGVCFGHQILARALGGQAVKSEGGWQLGVKDYEVVARPGWMAALPDRFALRAVHQDQVVALPPGATVLAAGAGCPYAALAYGDPDRPGAISVQPHPEFDADYLADLLRLRAGSVYPAEEAAAAGASLARATDDEAWARLIAGYLRHAAPVAADRGASG